MNTVNLVVCLIYLLLIPLILYFYKVSAKNATIHLTQSQIITSKQSITLTISRFFLYRYTGFSIKHPDKKYFVSQFLTIGVLTVTLLRLNRITFYQIAVLPVCFLITLIINDIWLLKGPQKDKSLQETDGQVIVQPRWTTMNLQQIIRSSLILIIIALLSISAYRVDASLSNLGQLNIVSSIIGLVIDQLVFRPLTIGLIIGGFKLAEMIRGSSILQQSNLIKQMSYQQYLRDPANENIIVQLIRVSQQQLKSNSEQKTSSPLRLPKTIQIQSQSNQGTLQQLLKLHSSICGFQKQQQIKVDDISIIDHIHDNHLQQVTSKGTDENRQDQRQQEMEMVELQVLKQKNEDPDLYLAKIWPQKQLDLPESFDNSPKYKKHRINKKIKTRVIKLTGNSPYLQYLPNMLKKQESENKLKNQSKNLLNNKTALIQSRK